MNQLEMDAVAEGLFLHLQKQSDNPLDGIAILGMTLLKIFDNAAQHITIEKFAEDFKLSLLESYKAKSSQGPATRQ